MNFFSFKPDESRANDPVFADENEKKGDDTAIGKDFKHLKSTSFCNIQNNLSRLENVIIVMNIEQMASESSTSSSTTKGNNVLQRATSQPVYSRVPSFGSKDLQIPPSPMMKSISSVSGDVDSSLPATHLAKRCFVFALAHAKTRTLTVYCFTTDASIYDSVKQLLEQLSEILIQRYHFANNTVLYKLGGLIGDSIIYDLKKV